MDESKELELEMKIAYQERTIGELSDLFAAETRRVDRMEAVLKSLTEKMRSIEDGKERNPPHDAKPPHY